MQPLLFQCIKQERRTLRVVRMRDADGGGLVRAEVLIALGKLGKRLLSAARFTAQDDLSLLVAGQDRLDLQDRADHGGDAAEPAAALEILQIVHGEILADAVLFLLERFDDGIERRALVAQTRRTQHLQALAQGGGKRIDNGDTPLRIGLAQLAGGKLRRLRRTADAAGHSDVEHVLSRLEALLHGSKERTRAYHRGLYRRTGAHGVIKRLAVKIVLRDVLLPVERVGKRDDAQVIALDQLCGQIGGGIGHDLHFLLPSLSSPRKNTATVPGPLWEATMVPMSKMRTSGRRGKRSKIV